MVDTGMVGVDELLDPHARRGSGPKRLDLLERPRPLRYSARLAAMSVDSRSPCVSYSRLTSQRTLWDVRAIAVGSAADLAVASLSAV